MWNAAFIEKTHLASDIWEFRFVKPAQYAYVAGQYAHVSLADVFDDPRGLARTMSFISHPTDPYLSFVTRVPTHRISPFKQRLSNLQHGEAIHLDAALGDLILPKLEATPLMFVAGGIGIASFIAMLKEVCLSDQSREISLLYALRSPAEKLFLDVLSAFSFASYREFAAPDRLNAHTIFSVTKEVPGTLFYLSGAERFVEGLRHDLLQTGLNDTQIIFDYFTGYDTL